jgi:polyhydroxyalkanoate synthesis regulator phasin
MAENKTDKGTADKATILDIVREGWNETLGKIAITREAAESAVKGTVARLVELGKLTQEEAKNFTSDLRLTIDKNRQELERRIDDSVGQALGAVRFPKREELETLRERIGQLEKMIDELAAKTQR